MMNIKALAFLLLISLTLASPSFAESGKIPWEEVPLNVQQTITQHVGSGEIKKVKKEKINLLNKKGEEKKTNVYLAKIKNPDGKKMWIVVDKSGELIDIEDEELEEIPEDEVGVKKQ